MQKKQWRRITLVASPDHQCRAYLTFLREVIDKFPALLVFNSTASKICWYQDDGWGTRIENLKCEFKKIESYSQYGHLASISEALVYKEKKENIVAKSVNI